MRGKIPKPMAKQITSVSNKPVNVWVPPNGKPPAQWTRAEIPKSPGEYQLIACDDDGNPIQFPLRTDLNWSSDVRDRMNAGCKSFQGLVYGGMTVYLYCRFWQLARSWPNNPPKELHDSRVTWNKRLDLQALYKPANMLCRYRRISAVDWHKKPAKPVQDILKVCWPDVGTNHAHPSAAAAITAETFSLLKWEKCFGKPRPDNLPALNIEQAERLGNRCDRRMVGRAFRRRRVLRR